MSIGMEAVQTIQASQQRAEKWKKLLERMDVEPTVIVAEWHRQGNSQQIRAAFTSWFAGDSESRDRVIRRLAEQIENSLMGMREGTGGKWRILRYLGGCDIRLELRYQEYPLIRIAPLLGEYANFWTKTWDESERNQQHGACHIKDIETLINEKQKILNYMDQALGKKLLYIWKNEQTWYQKWRYGCRTISKALLDQSDANRQAVLHQIAVLEQQKQEAVLQEQRLRIAHKELIAQKEEIDELYHDWLRHFTEWGYREVPYSTLY